MKVVAALCVLFLLASCSTGPETGSIVRSTASKSAGFSPRADGLYVGGDEGGSRSFLRFYDDHTVVEAGVTTNATPADVRRWLTKTSDKEISRGTWSPNGKFTVTSAEGDVDYTVTGQRDDGYTLSTHSKINGHDDSTTVTFSPDS
ncbi:hypothetical protein GCM10022222_33350 [Amycolatopsis ultiminotia]|uniref:Lipoprotein n=1 Tax=Amycolatopsis ultiminotia TaxID=543629 RepID=A0ABP6W7B6_9PSEU